MAQGNIRIDANSFEYDVISGEVIYIDENNIRNNITLNAVIVANYNELRQINNPKFNAVYIVRDSKTVYAFGSSGWVQLYTHDDIHQVISHLDDLTPSIMVDEDGNYIAPATTIGNIYSEKGLNIGDLVGNENTLRMMHVVDKHVEIENDNQRILDIPFPFSNYDLTQNYMGIIFNDKVIDPSNYIINGDQVIFTGRFNTAFRRGDLVLFTFFYTMAYNLNDNVVLSSQNIANHSITTDKLDPNITLKANNIIESNSRIFMTPDERKKLRGLNATNYVHPLTHPASMITETDNRKWLTPQMVEYWNAKANAEDVYTKSAVRTLIYNILETEDLSEFRNIAKAIGDDPNFATTILNKLAEKADTSSLTALSNNVDTKVPFTDYIRATIYDMPSKYTSDNIDYYTVRLSDGTFAEYIDGMSIRIKIGDGNNNNVKLRINELPFKDVVNSDQYQLVQGELKSGSIYNVVYNGTTGNFILQGKGGVKITNAALSKQRVGEDGVVNRGNPVDINIDGTINVARHKIEPVTKMTARNIPHVDCTDLYVDVVDAETILVTWFNVDKVYAITYNYENNYILNGPSKATTILQTDCTGYRITKLSDHIYGAIFKNGDTLTLKIIPINEDGSIDTVSVTSETIRANGQIEKLYFTPAGDSNFIIIYNHSNVTETAMYHYNSMARTLTPVSNRNNIDYPIDVMKRINANQLLFAGLYNEDIIGWVLTVEESDFYNSSTTKITSDTHPPGTVYSDLRLFALVDNRALLDYKVNNSKCKKIITITANGAISKNEETTYSYTAVEERHHDIVYREYIPMIDSFASISNYDEDLDTMSGVSNTVKILIEREGNLGIFYTTSKDNVLNMNTTATAMNLCVYGSLIVGAFFDDYGLNVCMYVLSRRPNGVATGNANVGELCEFYKF